MADRPIAEFLASLGLTGADADRARAALEADGITNPRKTRLSPGKVDAARARDRRALRPLLRVLRGAHGRGAAARS